MPRPGVFLDRDGVINENRADHVKAPREVRFIPGAFEALRRLSGTNFAIVLCTNQAVVGRGIISMEQATRINQHIIAEIEAHGGRVDAWYLCPHRPEEGCACRKPQPGMLLQAAASLNLDLANSFCIGDALTDVLAARSAGVKPILVQTGRGKEQALLLAASRVECPVLPDLCSAVEFVVAAEEGRTPQLDLAPHQTQEAPLSDRKGWIAMISEHASPLAALGGEDGGGQNVYVCELSIALACLGYRIDVFTRRGKPDQPEIKRLAPRVRVVSVTAGPHRPVPKDDLWPYMPAFLESCERFIAAQAERYTLVHSNFWMSGWTACELKRRMGLPMVHTFHALGEVKRRQQGAADRSPAERRNVELRIIREADGLIAQCPAEVRELTEFYGADTDRVRIVPSGVNARRFKPVPRWWARLLLGLPQQDWIVGYVGRLVPRKGVDTLVRAFARLAAERPGRRMRLMVVGGESREQEAAEGGERARLEGLAEELEVQELTWFTGSRQPRQLACYYGAADVMVSVPSYEPYGLTPLEAQACGRAFIGSAVGGIPYTVSDGVSGLLVPPGDDAALTARLGLLLDDPGLRSRLGRAGRERVTRRFTWELAARGTADVYGLAARTPR